MAVQRKEADGAQAGADAIMPAAAMRPLLNTSKQKPVSCAVALTKDKDAILLLHRTMRPRKVMAELRKQASAAKVDLDLTTLRFGRASVDGASDSQCVNISTNKEVPNANGFEIKLRERLKPAGFKRCSLTVDAALDGEPEDDAAPGGTASGTPAPNQPAVAAPAAPDMAMPPGTGALQQGSPAAPAAPARPAPTPGPAPAPQVLDGSPNANAGDWEPKARAVLAALAQQIASTTECDTPRRLELSDMADQANAAIKAGSQADATAAVQALHRALNAPGAGAATPPPASSAATSAAPPGRIAPQGPAPRDEDSALAADITLLTPASDPAQVVSLRQRVRARFGDGSPQPRHIDPIISALVRIPPITDRQRAGVVRSLEGWLPTVAPDEATPDEIRSRLAEAVQKAAGLVQGAGAEKLRDLASPQSAAILTAVTATFITAQLCPVGWAADVFLVIALGASAYMMGSEVKVIVGHFRQFNRLVKSRDGSLDEAAQHLADAVAAVGIDVLLGLLLHKAGSQIKRIPPANLMPPGMAAALADGGTMPAAALAEAQPRSGLMGATQAGRPGAPPVMMSMDGRPGDGATPAPPRPAEPPATPTSADPPSAPADVPQPAARPGSEFRPVPSPATPQVTLGRSEVLPAPLRPAAPPAAPDGLAYRTDLPRHLSGPDGFKSGRLHGTHNQQNAIAELQGRGGTYSIKPTNTPGVNELSYKVPNPSTGKMVEGTKTVYDTALFSDEQILELAQRAGERAFNAHKANPAQKSFDFTEGGVNFRAYINSDKATGEPYVGNVHPIP